MSKEEMVFFYPEGHEAHFEPGHPERPERIEAIVQALKGVGWWHEYQHIKPLQLSESVLTRIHHPAYLDMLQTFSRQGRRLDGDTYTTPASWELALQAAGGGAAVAEAVWEGRSRRGFALTRPPGHHATYQRGMGFCLLNNIALAAEYLLQEKGASRLAIVDFDLHHGNGTQDIFYLRADVFYISTHQSPLYPGTGMLEETGAEEGEGANANLPLPPGSGDEAFKAATSELILPLLGRYKPEMVLVSIGFDTHWRDPLGHLLLSIRGYGDMIKKLVDWADSACQGRLALFLEGGYDLQAGAATAIAVTGASLGRLWADPLGPSPYPEDFGWMNILQRAQKMWNL